jgi:hypothetical protein
MESRGTPTTAIQHPIAFASADTAREHLTRLASKRFSREKRKVLEALPPHYCGAWGTWQRYDGRPCYVLSPYDVPPGHPGRSAWYGKFAEVRFLFGSDGGVPIACQRYRCDRFLWRTAVEQSQGSGGNRPREYESSCS